jgi:hypothetical protein
LTERQISSEALDTEVAATALIGGAAADADQPFAKDCAALILNFWPEVLEGSRDGPSAGRRIPGQNS